MVLDSKYSTGWRFKPVFSIGLKKEDLTLPEQIKNYFSVGTIYAQGSEVMRYHVTAAQAKDTEKDLEIIINNEL